MGALLGLLLPLVPSIVNGIESLFSLKPSSGTDKMSAAMQALRAIVNQFIAAKVPLPDGTQPTQPTDDTLAGMIETVLQQLKKSGSLGTTPPAGSLFIVQGSVTPLKT